MTVIDELRAEVKWSQSNGEEVANGVSHGVGFLAAVVGTPILLEAAALRGSTPFLIGSWIFTATMVLLYLGSTAYHIWPRTRVKGALQVMDHSAIFLLIAGTYTPLILGPLHGLPGWVLLAIVWTIAAFGVVLKTVKGVHHRPGVSTALYLGMGWLIVLAIRPLALAIPRSSLIWLVAGGVIYTAGVIFYLNDHKRYRHFVWHLFVLGGTCCHYFAVLSCAA
ncbi:MAG: hemolysin III family protein [Chthoniobacterales bacterium]|nr:hemolysin III family protein [Chthoniobacterales bacterium]